MLWLTGPASVLQESVKMVWADIVADCDPLSPVHMVGSEFAVTLQEFAVTPVALHVTVTGLPEVTRDADEVIERFD